MERQHYFFDGFRAVGDVRHASHEVGRELGVERQECGPTAGAIEAGSRAVEWIIFASKILAWR